MRAATVLALIALAAGGCGRAWYRRAADRDSYQAIAERNRCPAWVLPRIDITPAPGSRIADPYDPDYPPLPPDDPAAHRYMHRPNGMHGSKHWHDDGDAPSVEPAGWWTSLPLNANGVLVLTPDRAVALALLNSREYQSALEDVYLSALALTLNRFEFAVQWFGRNTSTFSWFGSGPTENNTFTSASDLGFTKNFAAGGQLLADFANTVVVNLTHKQTVVTSDLVARLVQPLLRNAGRKVRLENLTQAERALLYAVRDFARFRKAFWADVTTRGNGFLALLLQVQNIRNLEINVVNQEQTLRLHEALFAGGLVSTVQVDQVFQSYQQARLGLLQAQTALDNNLDTFKISLGLPPTVPVRLDDAQLQPFQLADPALTRDQEEAEQLLSRFRQLAQAPPLAELRAGFATLRELPARAGPVADEVEGELRRWRARLDRPDTADDPATHAREQALYGMLVKQLAATREGLAELSGQTAKALAGLRESERAAAWRDVQRLLRRLIARLGELYVVQTQVRVFLIDLPPVEYTEAQALAVALSCRLDLMNQRGRTVDAWRKVAVAANGLEADLNLIATANVANEPLSARPFDFSASASSYTLGLQFDSPLNRYAERNIYRASLINYERARRAQMALEDAIRQSVRRDLRQLTTERLGFSIARQQLIAAARQLEGARENLLLAERGADSATSTLNILNALDSLLQARNALIGSYVNYETDRVQLLLDLEELQLNDRGIPADVTPTAAAALPDPAQLLPAPRRGP